MTDVLSIAASALIIIYAFSKLLSLFFTYFTSVLRAPLSRSHLLLELYLLQQFALALQEYTDSIQESPALQKLNSTIDEPLREYAKSLEDLRGSIEPAYGGVRGMLQSLVWPLKERGVMAELSRFGRVREIFELALGMDHETILRNMESHVRQTWIATQAIETCAKNTNVTVYETKKLLSPPRPASEYFVRVPSTA
ncbi:uncharacterized protein H6S33_007652 [Morchella sextelata]|uniref:uncharacterized protein n=1 Tax=Morchella sextelata TaxID=1174677 RepID=UPI001D054214|nr:uncharacterized protein H6S33_007652 [Morchella sextelata]KAH0603330.1 hypothetical protein H6S33_007652 [Morchella sextelata]